MASLNNPHGSHCCCPAEGCQGIACANFNPSFSPMSQAWPRTRTTAASLTAVTEEDQPASNSSDQMQEFQSNGICSPTSCVSEVDETKGIYTCSEEEVLNITFEACDTMGTGEVLASTVVQYLQDMTAQSPERGRLVMLHNMLDPGRQGVTVNRDAFHAAMKRWIVECSQDCMLEEDCQNAETEKNRIHINGNELSAAESEKAFHEGTDGLDHETSDLINRVADLQYANQKLSEQNSSLLRAVEMCEEANLQLTDDIVTLKSKLTR
ncbi:lymphoid-restricted membrane protein-like [Acipenser oxyrinchus oxyrinchus]|uniref:Lymphoid-restricted membrane protein-like n=1 Tax=Acipenser oxyrinchus oxyrinchus TaxID=40147 RepID=A0AAD8D2D0_ACIOX|nr:lymphoid-restricted membrane protein-like [Acipenser oxyrinchus oxyrinchus]